MLPQGFEIVSAGSSTVKLIDYAKKGALKGVYLGYPTLDEHYTMSLPGVTDWLGIPKSGKTELLLDLLYNTSEFYGWKHLLYVPDIGSEEEVIADLIHKRTGKTFDKRFQNVITADDIYRETPWVSEHFKILVKKDLSAKMTPVQFWDLGVTMQKSHGIHTLMADSWKDLHHDHTRRTDQYLEEVLSYRNAISDKHGLHIHTILHPLKTEKDKNGKRTPPTPYDSKGGTEWFNNGRNMITVHRPTLDTGEVEVYLNKIKPRSIGKEGVVNMWFDPRLRKYFLLNLNERVYAAKEKIQLSSESLSQEDDEIPF